MILTVFGISGVEIWTQRPNPILNLDTYDYYLLLYEQTTPDQDNYEYTLQAGIPY